MVKALIGTSREEAARLIAAGLVSLNHLPSLSASAPVREGDCLSVRGKGRYMVDALGPADPQGPARAVGKKMCIRIRPNSRLAAIGIGSKYSMRLSVRKE